MCELLTNMPVSSNRPASSHWIRSLHNSPQKEDTALGIEKGPDSRVLKRDLLLDGRNTERCHLRPLWVLVHF